MDLSEQLRLEQQQRITKLSEAIRIGARIRPQCVEYAFLAGKSCAIGAAAEALGMPYQNATLGGEAWDFIISRLALPQDWAIQRPLYSRIWKMNDGRDCYCMTREAIADVLAAEGY